MRFLSIKLLCVLWAQACFALTDEEYNQLLQSSPKFREENSWLMNQWKGMKKVFKKADVDKILADQRQWVTKDRDREAQKNMAAGYTREYAYAKATHGRTAKLWDMEENYKLTPEEKAAGDWATPEYYDAPTGSLYGAYDGKSMGEITKIIPTAGDLCQIYVRDSYGHTHICCISNNDISDKKSAYFKEDFSSECGNPEPRENSRPYLLEILGEISTQKYVRKLGEARPRVKILTNFSQCYG